MNRFICYALSLTILLEASIANAEMDKSIQTKMRDHALSFLANLNGGQVLGAGMAVGGAISFRRHSFMMAADTAIKREMLKRAYGNSAFPMAIVGQIGSGAVAALGAVVFFFSSMGPAHAANLTSAYRDEDGFKRFLQLPQEKQKFLMDSDPEFYAFVVAIASKLELEIDSVEKDSRAMITARTSAKAPINGNNPGLQESEGASGSAGTVK
jgi:hypothetical protein